MDPRDRAANTTEPEAEDGWTEEVQASHRDLSDVDFAYRQMARRHPDLLAQATFAPFERERDLLKYAIQPWPTFVGPKKLAEFKRVSAAINRLIRLIPARLFRNDPERLSRFFEFGTPEQTAIVFAKPSGIEAVMSRGDFIDTRDGFKCIEFNFTPNLGGWETSVLASLHREIPATAEFLRARGVELKYTNTMGKLFFHAIGEALRRGILRGGELNVALALRDTSNFPTRSLNDFLNAEYGEVKAGLGGRVRGQAAICHVGDLSSEDDGLRLDGLTIGALIEVYNDVTPGDIYRNFKADQLVLLNGPVASFLSNKKNIALLSSHADSPLYSAEEQEVIRRHIPWTRQISDDTVDFEGTRVDLPELLARERRRMVLKDVVSYGGKGVVVGAFAAPDAWDQAVRTALASGNWVVQEFLESRPYLFQAGTHGCSPHDAIWGPFYFGNTYAGGILRVQPKSFGGPVNLSLTATEGVLLEV